MGGGGSFRDLPESGCSCSSEAWSGYFESQSSKIRSAWRLNPLKVCSPQDLNGKPEDREETLPKP